jgi:hypothetical protein
MIDFLGIFTLVNLIWLASVVLVVGATSWIFLLHLLPLIIGMPIELLELSLYGVDALLLYGAHEYAVDTPHALAPVFLALTACMAMPCLYALTLSRHFKKTDNAWLAFQVGSWLFSAVWSAVALWFDSQLIGFLAVVALFVALGFIFIPLPFVYLIGFGKRDMIPRSMGVAFCFLSAYIYLAFNDAMWSSSAVPRVFRPGITGMGTFVFFLGGIIVSSRYYHGNDVDVAHYIWVNLFVCACGMCCVALGSMVPELYLLKSVGGTFFVLFLLEKYIEIPWRNAGWVWAALLLGVLLYGISWWASENPEYLLSF